MAKKKNRKPIDFNPATPDATPDIATARSKSELRAEQVQRAKEDAQRKRRRLVVWQLAIGALVVAVVVAVTVVLLTRQDDAATTVSDSSGASDGAADSGTGGTDGTDTAGGSSSAPPEVNEDGAFVVGNPDAKVTVQVVEDFQCPICQQFEAAAGDLLTQYADGDDVKVEYRGIAFLDRASTTRYSSRALNASACTMSQGADVWTEFHRQMYVQQPPEGGDGLPDSTLVDIAVAAGADEDEVASCVEDQTYAAWVVATTNASGDDGVTGTPTIFVDGDKLDGFDPAAVQAAVDEALAS